jgi:hypothetical protein
MEESAVRRTPNEIWAMILRRAVLSPIFPFMDDSQNYLHADIIENIQLFPYECEVYRQAITAEKAWKILRLVCRSWESIISDFHQGCIFAHTKGVRYPAINKRVLEGLERVQVVWDSGDGYCTCGGTPCHIKDHKYSPIKDQEPRLQDFDEERLTQLFRHVRTLTLTDWELDRKWLISSMPKLQALNLYHPSRALGPPLDALSTFIPDHSSLTHLQLDNLTWKKFYVHLSSKNIFLRSLHYLALDFNDQWDDEIDIEGRKFEWNSPKLKHLVIRGYANLRDKEELDLFLQTCGKTVIEYVVTCSFSEHTYNLPHIEHFPHLCLYGSSFFYLFSRIRSSTDDSEMPSHKNTNLRTLIVFEFNDAHRLDPEEFAMQFASLIKTWGFKEIRVDAIPESFWFNKFLTRFTSMNLKLFDLKGVEIQTSGEGGTFDAKFYATCKTLDLRI